MEFAYWIMKKSYKEYKQAYDDLMGMNEDLSLDQFNKVKVAYEETLETLVYKAADYSKVQEILNKVPEDLSLFDTKKVEALNKVIASIDYNKNIKEQKVVDQYAQDLQKALDEVLKSLNQTDDNKNPNKPSIDSDVLGDKINITNKEEPKVQPNQTINNKTTNNYKIIGAKTGDNVMIAPYVILAICSIGVYMTIKKRKHG